MLEFRKFSEFPRGTLYDILQDAYSYDSRNKELWDENWHESDEFFYDNPEIADNYGFRLYDKKKNYSESAYTGDYLYYEIIL